MSNSIKKTTKLQNDNGLVVMFSSFGARITSVKYLGKEIARNGYISGRCANRIAGASFVLNNQTYYLDQNEGNNHLHGGSLGFRKKNWLLKEVTDRSVTFFLHSPDGDMGYPGNLDIIVTYTLTEDNDLIIEYHAKSDKDTIINPINHLFINNSNHDIELLINANFYTEKDTNRIPTGKILKVDDSIYDFRNYRKTNPDISYDINYVLNEEGYRKVASLKKKGQTIDIYSDRPGVQLYQSKKHICLETQVFPDAINHANFPSPILKKDTAFYTKTVYCFRFDKD